jgi:1-acyl-sn-glycerol-3-phosphate acyltransferase
MIYYISRSILWLLFKICFRYEVRYAENIPGKGPFIIASNHLSFLDPAAAGFITKRQVCFLARADLFNGVLFKRWAQSVGVIPINRGRFDLSAIKGSLARLRKGYIVALFPEGTRSKDGSIKDPKSGVGFLAVKANVPVVPILIKGSDKALPAHAIMIRFKPVEVRIAKPVAPTMFLQKDGEYDYQAMSEEIMERIRRLGIDED